MGLSWDIYLINFLDFLREHPSERENKTIRKKARKRKRKGAAATTTLRTPATALTTTAILRTATATAATAAAATATTTSASAATATAATTTTPCAQPPSLQASNLPRRVTRSVKNYHKTIPKWVTVRALKALPSASVVAKQGRRPERSEEGDRVGKGWHQHM